MTSLVFERSRHLAVAPWMRCHPDEIERGTAATLCKGTRAATKAGAFTGVRGDDYAILTRPATVDAVARNDDGSIHSLALVDEKDGTRRVLEWRIGAYYHGHARWEVEPPMSPEGWYCVVGLRWSPPQMIAVVCDNREMFIGWAQSASAWGRETFGVVFRDGNKYVGLWDDAALDGQRSRRDGSRFLFDDMIVLGRPSAALIARVRDRLVVTVATAGR